MLQVMTEEQSKALAEKIRLVCGKDSWENIALEQVPDIRWCPHDLPKYYKQEDNMEQQLTKEQIAEIIEASLTRPDYIPGSRDMTAEREAMLIRLQEVPSPKSPQDMQAWVKGLKAMGR